MASSSHLKEVPERTSPPTPQPQANNPVDISSPASTVPSLPPRAASLPVPSRPPSRSPPGAGFQPGVHLPINPPSSPSYSRLCAGSGPSTPTDSPLYLSGIRFPVISCPYSSQPIPIPDPSAVEREVSLPPSLEWDDYSEELQFDLHQRL